MASTTTTLTTTMAKEEAIRRDVGLQGINCDLRHPAGNAKIAVSSPDEEEAALEMVRMYKRQMEEIHAVLTQHRHNLSAELLVEGEEMFIGWEEELHENLSLQRLGCTERAQVTAGLRDCSEGGIFLELRAGLHANTRIDDLKRCYVELEEGQVLCAKSQDRFYEDADDITEDVNDESLIACISATSANKDAAIGNDENIDDDNNDNNNNNDDNHNGDVGALHEDDEDNNTNNNIDDDINNNNNNNNNNNDNCKTNNNDKDNGEDGHR
ncbi:hypothetical protein CBR_g54930 [Chara braunii]|uniref:Uncharacterized protein n=1 Tax=Chara braunii TaxID=69332 RepID=A0A388JPY2_CHABU|nr:hypothetical protein CBR_g54930 [Chara braunii]|eukprot:GBG59828.1 hypothetical protein CBR_g54930 [Chara braunii]